MNLTIAQLIEQLITQQQKCWHAIDRVNELSKRPAEELSYKELTQLGKASAEAHRSNAARSKLVNAIDVEINRAITEGKAQVFSDPKTYSE